MNTLKPYVDAVVGAGGLAVLALGVVKVPDHLRNQTALNFLSAGDTSVDYLKEQEKKYAQKLEVQEPEAAQQIISSCQEQLNSCLGDVQIPYGKSCERFVGMNALKFHDSLLPRQRDYLFDADPEKNECDLQIQSQIVKCHEKAVYCLEKPLRK
ncbi:hypothetical protein IT413_04700 [Candidatus Peregrinibacteria bacterium]|nr:hypothetical protein [Candidatus Peregrinibacteria bacterium]